MLLAHYQTLYDSSVAFGMRKALKASKEKQQKVKQIAGLEQEVALQEQEIASMEAKYEEIVIKDKEAEHKEVIAHQAAIKQFQLDKIELRKRLEEQLYAIDQID